MHRVFVNSQSRSHAQSRNSDSGMLKHVADMLELAHFRQPILVFQLNTPKRDAHVLYSPHAHLVLDRVAHDPFLLDFHHKGKHLGSFPRMSRLALPFPVLLRIVAVSREHHYQVLVGVPDPSFPPVQSSLPVLEHDLSFYLGRVAAVREFGEAPAPHQFVVADF